MADSTGTRDERRAAAREERKRAADAQSRQRRQRLWILGGLAALAVVVIAAIAIAGGGGGDDERTTQAGGGVAGTKESAALFAGIPQDGVVLGDPDAPVTLVEFADLQCPFCKDYTEAVMPALVEQYVATGDVKMVFRNLAFLGTDSLVAAQMAGAAALQDKLWNFVHLFYTNQGAENSGYVTDEFLRDIAGGVKGLDVEQAMEDRGSGKVDDQLVKANEEAQLNGIEGTPSFLIGRTGGTLKPLQYQGFNVEEFTAKIDPLLERAQK